MSLPRHSIDAPVFVYDDGERTGEHIHETHQLVYAQSGLLSLFVGNDRWVVPPLRAVWVPAGTPHELLAHGTTLTRPLYLDPAIAPDDFTNVTVIAVNTLLRELIVAVGEPDLGEGEREHIEQLIIARLQRVKTHQLRLIEPIDERLVQIGDGLRADPADRRTLAEWGQHVGASERTLVRLFKSETATTFAHWRTQIRLHHGLVLLSQGATVTVTAFQCGYHNTSSFIEQFRRALGTTPGVYLRDLQRGSRGSDAAGAGAPTFSHRLGESAARK